ncbi:MAG: hypothetical protein NT027_18280 [Proteobacteria bacterium]|nr:hypothetical protein [Pseudomonadota bacterium]
MKWLELVTHAADSILRSVMGMKPSFILLRQRLTRSHSYENMVFRNTKDKIKGLELESKSRRPELVKNRPAGLEERYVLCESSELVDEVFKKLRSALFEECDSLSVKARNSQGGTIVVREIGKTSEGRPFMYFKPFNDFGWLVEKSGPGWRVSRAEKIVKDQMFLRSQSDPWDLVMVFEDPQGVGSVRIKSQRFGGSLLAVPVYELKMRESFGNLLMGAAA